MRFCQQLQVWMEQTDCRASELCARSGVAAPSLSRYRAGERTPGRDSAALDGLCRGLAELAQEKGIPGMAEAEVRAGFLSCEEYAVSDRVQLRENFNTLVEVMELSISRLCRYANYDPSTVFRFRSGARQPADPVGFAGAVAAYVSRELDDIQHREIAGTLLGCEAAALADRAVYCQRLRDWLLGSHAPRQNAVDHFLAKLDDFDLNEYIRSIRFNELKVPTAPFQLPTSRSYFGLQQMMESELDFMKAAVLSRSMEPVIMYSDMPMEQMAKDPDFPKKWMFGMAMLLKKGLKLRIIHNIDRSLSEMMLGLESFIPMYMTGQIEPYYFKNPQNGVFLHFMRSAGTVALTGEAIAGHHSEGRYDLTKVKGEVAYCRRRAEAMLAQAEPLMDIYREDDAVRLNAFLLADSRTPGPRRQILSVPPLYSMEPAYLETLLTQQDVPEEERQRIAAYARVRREQIEHILSSDTVRLELPRLSPEAFAQFPPSLPLSGLFYERDVPYTYETYLAHVRQTEAFAAAQPHCRLEWTGGGAFRNLQICIHEGQWAMVSKGKSPAIHFVIRHPKLRTAIERFVPPVVEVE